MLFLITKILQINLVGGWGWGGVFGDRLHTLNKTAPTTILVLFR